MPKTWRSHQTIIIYRSSTSSCPKQFSNPCQKTNKILIVRLKRSNGTITTDRDEMRHIVAAYYESLLSADTPSAETLQMRQKVWTTIVVGVGGEAFPKGLW